jgi:hypothetical protein
MPLDSYYQYSDDSYPTDYVQSDEYGGYSESEERELSDQYVQAAEQYITNALATESQSSFEASIGKLTAEQLSKLNSVLDKIENKQAIADDEKEIFLNFVKPLIPSLRTWTSGLSGSGNRYKKMLEERIRVAQKRLESLKDRYQQMYGQNFT